MKVLVLGLVCDYYLQTGWSPIKSTIGD